MTIDEVYRFIQFIANKDQRGFIKPSEFNLAATRAQLDVIEEKFKERNSHKNLDDLAPVVNVGTLAYSSPSWTYPAGFLHFVSLEIGGNAVELIGLEKLQYRVDSSIVSPSQTYPLAVMINSGFKIYNNGSTPASSGTVTMSYIKEPTAPKWTYTIVNGAPVYNGSAADAQGLTLPSSTHKDICHKIAEYVGVSLRDEDVVTFGASFGLSSKEQ
jgi:hypothetical protein